MDELEDDARKAVLEGKSELLTLAMQMVRKRKTGAAGREEEKWRDMRSQKKKEHELAERHNEQNLFIQQAEPEAEDGSPFAKPKGILS